MFPVLVLLSFSGFRRLCSLVVSLQRAPMSKDEKRRYVLPMSAQCPALVVDRRVLAGVDDVA